MLLVLNNIFVRLLSGQMFKCYDGLLSDFICTHRKFHSWDTSLLRLTKDWRLMRELRGGGGGGGGGTRCGSFHEAIDVIQYPLLLSKLWAYGMGVVP